MKKIILAASVIMLSLVGCQTNQPAATAGADNNNGAGFAAQELTVAYVHIDSLIMNYDRAIDMQKAFEDKYRKAERELQTKMQKLEKDVMDYQDKAQKGLMTRSQMAETEEKLGRQQQNLMEDRDRLMNELAEEEQVMTNTIFYAVSDFLKDNNSDFKYSMIISTTASGPILHANPALSITEPVLKALNEAYAKEKTTKKK